MATISISNDKITTFPLAFENFATTVVSAPAGDTFAASASSASLLASIGGIAGAPALVLTPKVQAGNGYTVTVTDSLALLPPLVVTVNITPDPVMAASWSVNTGPGATITVAQPVPTAPGP